MAYSVMLSLNLYQNWTVVLRPPEGRCSRQRQGFRDRQEVSESFRQVPLSNALNWCRIAHCCERAVHGIGGVYAVRAIAVLLRLLEQAYPGAMISVIFAASLSLGLHSLPGKTGSAVRALPAAFVACIRSRRPGCSATERSCRSHSARARYLILARLFAWKAGAAKRRSSSMASEGHAELCPQCPRFDEVCSCTGRQEVVHRDLVCEV